ncbi:hypothetical protein BCON_0222g00190 [Botryotinia convoluta]|uniref:Uncharacterized protein n=1 Tax=Botryotinia convoluta TaxID=54673 RepID=A0A4Z1HJ48_9HELO|nr:hypothetical protein BCON_0222g00190 [Botryotinia convoluta]
MTTILRRNRVITTLSSLVIAPGFQFYSTRFLNLSFKELLAIKYYTAIQPPSMYLLALRLAYFFDEEALTKAKIKSKPTQTASPYHISCLDPWCGERACKLFSDNITFTAGIQKFLMTFLPVVEIHDSNHHFDPSKLQGTIVLPLLSQNETFNSSHRNWDKLSAFIEGVLSPIIVTYSTNPNNITYECSKPWNTEALRIRSSQSVSSRQKLLGIPLSDDALKVNYWSHVQIEANIHWERYHCYTPSKGIKSGPWVAIIPFGNWQVEGGMVKIRREKGRAKIISFDGDEAPKLISGKMLNLPQGYQVESYPIKLDGKVRFQLEFFKPELPGEILGL